MADIHDRSRRFEMIAACPGGRLRELADAVLDTGPPLRVLQEPKPHLVMQRVVEPVERRPFHLGEVLVTAAEVEVAGERGFAMIGGKAEEAALSGAIVDAAVEVGHPRADEVAAELRAAVRERDADRNRRWAESRETAVEFESMEGEL